jgi:DNA-binding MarR family transcriptional regulator
VSERTVIGDAERTTDLFVGVLAKALTGQVLEEAFEGQVTVAQLQALRFLLQNEQRLMSDLADGLAISYPAATKTVERLVKKDLVAREGDPADRRVVRVRLTEQGTELVRRINGEMRTRLESALGRMADDDRQALMRGMTAFVGAALQGIDDEELIDAVCLHCGNHHLGDCPIQEARDRAREGSQVQSAPVE